MFTYGDGVTNQNLKKLLNFHYKHNKIGTMTAVKPPARFGELFLKGNRITSFEEKPQLKNNWINGGFFVFNYKIFNYLENDKTMLEREPLKKLVKRKQLIAFKHGGYWQCMDTRRDYDLLQKQWKTKKILWLK